jgi:hypothetical protein
MNKNIAINETNNRFHPLPPTTTPESGEVFFEEVKMNCSGTAAAFIPPPNPWHVQLP